MANGKAAASGALSGAAAGATIGGPWGAAIGGVVGGAAGLFSGDGDGGSEESRKAAIDAITRVGDAPDLSDPVILKAYQDAGLLTPELLQKLSLNADSKNQLIENPEDKKQQEYALNALKDMSQTGLTATDRASFNKLRGQVAADTQAKTNQILQQQQMRGQLSGGNTLAAQLASIQGGNQTASQEADRLASQAVQARTSALNNFSNLSGQMRGTDLGLQTYNNDNDLARQRFLDQNSLSRQASNVSAQNAANNINLNRQQITSDRNTASQNSELYRQLDAKNTAWKNNLDAAKAKAGIYTTNADAQAKAAANQAGSTQSMITSGLGAIGQIAGGFKGGGSLPTADATNTPVPSSDSYTMPSFGSSGTASTGGFHLAHGGVVPGIAPVHGDSPENDIVPASLSPGEIVIPRSFAHDPDLSKAYINFIHKHKGKK